MGGFLLWAQLRCGGDAKEIDAFNAANRELSTTRGVRYVDVTQASRDASGDETRFAPDGLHYSGLMRGHWAKEALGAMMALPAAAWVTGCQVMGR